VSRSHRAGHHAPSPLTGAPTASRIFIGHIIRPAPVPHPPQWPRAAVEFLASVRSHIWAVGSRLR